MNFSFFVPCHTTLKILSHFVCLFKAERAYSFCGTIEYMAPDIVRGGDSGHDKVCSIFDTFLYISIKCIIRILVNNVGTVSSIVLFLALSFLHGFLCFVYVNILRHLVFGRKEIIERLGHSRFPFFQVLLVRIIFSFIE